MQQHSIPAKDFTSVCSVMMVGSIHTTVEEGVHTQHGQEFGYFAFGMYSQTENPISSS
jgi:phosphatidylserine decarboxylase